jgi:hypothetical protein
MTAPAGGAVRRATVTDHWQNPEKLARFMEATTRGRYTPVPPDRTGILGAHGRAYVPIQLEGGHSYLFQATCDAACTDLDMAIVTPAEEELASDDELDNTPQIFWHAPVRQVFRVLITMTRCEARSCEYRLSLYRQN